MTHKEIMDRWWKTSTGVWLKPAYQDTNGSYIFFYSHPISACAFLLYKSDFENMESAETPPEIIPEEG